MALAATPPPTDQPRPSLTALRGRKPDRRTEVADLQDELHALHAERNDVGTEIEALSRRIEYAIGAERPDVALHVAGRLEALAHSLQRRGAA
jgi:uncharacterized protein YlxW (UPF0749 family)